MERNIFLQTTHKLMYYVIMWVYRLLQFKNYIVQEQQYWQTQNTKKLMYYMITKLYSYTTIDRKNIYTQRKHRDLYIM